MTLLAQSWEREPGNLRRFGGLSAPFFALVAIQIIGYTLPLLLPHLEVTRDVGVSMYAALLLWLLACASLLRREKVTAGQRAAPEPAARAA
jgi:hypothetical protein